MIEKDPHPFVGWRIQLIIDWLNGQISNTFIKGSYSTNYTEIMDIILSIQASVYFSNNSNKIPPN